MISSEAQLVKQALLDAGLETPLKVTEFSPEQKYERIKGLFTEIVDTLGLDLEDDSLNETPHRIAKMYVREIFAGLDFLKTGFS